MDVSPDDLEILEKIAAFKNKSAEARDQVLRKKWTRKSLAESFLAIQCRNQRQQIASMVEALGPLPDADDEKAMAKYAKRVVEWEKKNLPNGTSK